MNKREFLKLMGLATTGMACHMSARAQQTQSVYVPPNLLWLRRANEQMQINYSTTEGYRALQYFLRDVRANRVGHPDFRLVQTLSWIQAWLALYGHHVCFNVLSGLRTFATNSTTEGAAQNSLHLPDERGMFKAIDYRAPGIPSNYLAQVTARLQQGGVGFYQRDFLHTDTGAVVGKNEHNRIWTGQ